MFGSTCASHEGMVVSLEAGWPSALCHPITLFSLLGFRLFEFGLVLIESGQVQANSILKSNTSTGSELAVLK